MNRPSLSLTRAFLPLGSIPTAVRISLGNSDRLEGMKNRRRLKGREARATGPPYFIAALASPVGEHRAVTAQLKTRSEGVIRAVLNQIAQNPVLLKRASGNLFPRDSTTVRFTFPTSTGDLLAETRWALVLCNHFSAELARFVEYQQSFLVSLLRHDFAAASRKLDACSADLGFNTWAAEASLLIAELQHGSTAHNERLLALQGDAEDVNLQILLGLVSQRINQLSPATAYDCAVNDLIARHSGTPALQDVVTYFRHRLDIAAPPTDRHAYAVAYEARHSLPDAYQQILRVVAPLVAWGKLRLPPDAANLLRTLASKVPDFRLRNLVQLLYPATPIQHTSLNSAAIAAADSYTVGDYDSCITICAKGIDDFPFAFEFYELWAKSIINSGSPAPALPLVPTLEARLKDDLLACLRPDTLDRRTSLSRLLKIAYTFDSYPLGRQVLSLTHQISGKYSRRTTYILSSLNASALTARFSNAFKPQSDAIQFIAALAESSPESPSIDVFSALHKFNDESNLPSLMASEQHRRYAARIREQRGDLVGALQAYTELRLHANAGTTFADDALQGLFDCQWKLGALSRCAELVVECTLADTQMPPSASLDGLIRAYARQEATGSYGNIAWPVFHHMFYTQGGPLRDPHEVFIALDQYLGAHGWERPSDILRSAAITPTPTLTYMLRYVCSLDVLEYSIHYDNLDEVEQDRITLCEQLIRIDPDNTSIYTDEVKSLLRRRQIRTRLQHIEASKVHVDLAGIRRSLDQPFLESVASFVNMAVKSPAALSRQFIVAVPEATPDATTSRQYRHYGTFGRILFDQIFSSLHGRFISSNEFGLDSYLSLRIRHGILLGQIRSHFEVDGIITRKGSDDAYQPNQRWAADLARFGSKAHAAADRALATLSADIDRTIGEVKAQWIQIRGESNKQKGLFDYSYTSLQIAHLYNAALKCRTPDDLIELVFEDLLARTRENLEVTRAQVRDVLTESLVGAVDRCFNALVGIHSEFRFSPLLSAMTQCKTRVRQEMEAISNWFVLQDDPNIANYELTELVNTVVAAITHTNPTCPISLDSDVRVASPCLGSTFHPLFDLLFILIDNVVRHCGMLSPRATVSARAAGSELMLYVENEVAMDADALAARVKELQQRLAQLEVGALVRQEGGTGYSKALKILKHDLKLGKDFRIEVRTNNGRFAVAIAMPQRKIIA